MLDGILANLRPETLGDLFIYIIFIGGLISTLFIPEKNNQPLYLMFAVMFFAVLDLIRGDGTTLPIEGFSDDGFATYLIHIGMGILPFVAAGMVRFPPGRKKSGITIPFLILIGFIGALYAVGTFAVPDAFYNNYIF
jgi:hypothetical protein